MYGLVHAAAVARPAFIPQARPRRGSAKFGLSYEARVASATGGLRGQWWTYVTADGETHWCQTDVLLRLGERNVVLEVKLTEADEARSQLAKYVPIVAHALRTPCHGIVVCRHLSRERDLRRVVTSMAHALRVCSASYYPTLHWLAKGPI